MSQEKPSGIDLGTTNSAMAWIDESNRSAMIRNAEDEFITPSVVYFSDNEVVVGKNARTAIVAHPDMVAQWVKRDMGAPFYSHPIRGQYLPPEVIQACILRKLKEDLFRALGPDTRTVITVPAYFDELRRKATADAGEMAGLSVLDIVNEPTAAALAFGESLGYLSADGQTRAEMNVMVYDLGGGTFDVTLLRLANGNVTTLATDGDVQLGGHDWDQRLVDYAAGSFQKSHGVDPRQDPATLNRLYQTAMETKHTLTARSRAALRVEFAGRSSDLQILREQFEEMTTDLLERTAYTSRQLLAAAKMDWKDLQRILLVGGSSRMPMVADMLQKMTGIPPDRSVNPDEAIARGAALYANHLLAKAAGGSRKTFSVTNVNAHSLGIEGIDSDTMRKKNVILIRRNSPLPAKFTERFATKSEGQRSIVIKVLEGESSLPAECIPIGRTVVRDLPGKLPKGWPIEVTFEYATNGRLSVDATVPGTQHRSRLELERDVGLSGEGIARWKQPIAAAAGFGAFESAVAALVKQPELASGALPTPPTVASPLSRGPAKAEVAQPPLAAKAPIAMPPVGPAAKTPAPGPAFPPSGPATMPRPRPTEPAPVRPKSVPASPASQDLFAGMAMPGLPPAASTPPAPSGAWAAGPQGPDLQPSLGQFSPSSAGVGQPQAGPTVDPSVQPLPAAEAAGYASAPKLRRKREPLMPLWLSRLIGHVVAAGLGLGTAYLLLSRFRPDLFKF